MRLIQRTGPSGGPEPQTRDGRQLLGEIAAFTALALLLAVALLIILPVG